MSTSSASAARPRSIVYVDGYNLFHGALSHSPNRWLNIERYFVLLRQHDEVERIHFFTARVPSAAQHAYFRALTTLSRVNIVEGKFKDREVVCRVSACTYTGNKVTRMPTEKRTDVNIALQMLDDAHRDACDVMVLVSGDSDLVPVIEMVRRRAPNKKLVVYVPARDPIRGAAVELRTAAHQHRTLPLELLSKCQFPDGVADGRGGWITKPSGW